MVSILAGPVAAQFRPEQRTADIGRVIVNIRTQDVPFQVQNLALVLADEIFAGVGVKIDWRHEKSAARSFEHPNAIELMIAPEHSRPHPVAYALPYEGVHIRVFYDRVEVQPNRAAMLAHVLVHEITHILQGVVRHSETGMMKAHWTADDVEQMGYSSLPFTALDIALIRSGMARRTEIHSSPAAENSADEVADSH